MSRRRGREVERSSSLEKERAGRSAFLGGGQKKKVEKLSGAKS